MRSDSLTIQKQKTERGRERMKKEKSSVDTLNQQRKKNKVSGITVILGGSKQLPGVVQQKSGSENVFSLLHQEK